MRPRLPGSTRTGTTVPERQVRLEPYEGGHTLVAELCRVPVSEVGPDEHAHHSHEGVTYMHEHGGGQQAHHHRLTVEWNAGLCEWVGVDLEPDDLPVVVTEEMVEQAQEAALAAGAPARIHPEVLRAILATAVRRG